MLITAVVVPGPPGFVAELMGSAAHELDDLRAAADRALSRAVSDLLAVPVGRSSEGSALCAGSALSEGSVLGAGAVLGPESRPGSGSSSAQLVVVGPGEPGEFNAAGPVSFASFGRDVHVPALPGGQPGDGPLPTPILVARYLASRDVAAHPQHAQLWASARWITTSADSATDLGEQLGADDSRIGLVLVADGAACHGPKAPRAQDARAQAYDDGVWAALASGEPARLAKTDLALGDALGASGSQVWPVLVAATAAADSAGIGEVLWAGAPYGVGWAVASWRSSATTAMSTRTWPG